MVKTRQRQISLEILPIRRRKQVGWWFEGVFRNGSRSFRGRDMFTYGSKAKETKPWEWQEVRL